MKMVGSKRSSDFGILTEAEGFRDAASAGEFGKGFLQVRN